MSAEEHGQGMQVEEDLGAALAREAQRYLAVVEVFRREGCEPKWRPEPPVHAFVHPCERRKRWSS